MLSVAGLEIAHLISQGLPACEGAHVLVCACSILSAAIPLSVLPP